MPPVVLDEFHGLERVVDAPLCNGNVERLPLRPGQGDLLVPVAPDDDRLRIGSREYRSFAIGEKPSELLLRPERNTVAAVKVTMQVLRIFVKTDLAPFLGGEITVEPVLSFEVDLGL